MMTKYNLDCHSNRLQYRHDRVNILRGVFFALQTGSVRINIISEFCKMSESSKLEVRKYLIFHPVITNDEFALDVTQFVLQSCLRALYSDLSKIAFIRCIPT